MSTKGTHDIGGDTICLHWVVCVARVRERYGRYFFFVGMDGYGFDYFYDTEEEAKSERTAFIDALQRFWHKMD